MNTIGQLVRRKRTLIPLTLQELSAASGVSSSHLGRIERGERFPSAWVLNKIAKPLGFQETELLARAGYLSSGAVTTKVEIGLLDPYVARLLAREPVETQRAIVGLFFILKLVVRQGQSSPLHNAL